MSNILGATGPDYDDYNKPNMDHILIAQTEIIQKTIADLLKEP